MWSKENLTDLIDARLSGHPFILVSNREPYRHSYVDGAIEWGNSHPAVQLPRWSPSCAHAAAGGLHTEECIG
jgi:hypothetical protein